MPIDFHFVPISGELSGKSFEEQTKRAFNELGVMIDASQNAAADATATADNAVATANDALNTAQNALDTAQDAADSAQNAQNAAQTAQTCADAAQTRADSAYDLAAVALSTANSKGDAAQATADSALEAAQKAQATADTAQSTATQGLATAQSAQNLAEEANGLFPAAAMSEPGEEEESAAPDADAYPDPEKVFFDGSFPVRNLPEGYADKGGYLKVYATESENGDSRILQTFYAPDGAAVFRREGRRTIIEGQEGEEGQEENQEPEESLTWGEWTCLPKNAVTTDTAGKIPAAVLPEDVVRTVNGKIPTALLPDEVQTGGGFQISENEPQDPSKLWIRSTDSTAYYHDGTAWKPIVGVYAETTTP